jgi:hypothetical protein
MSNGTLRGILTMDARCYKLYIYLGFLEKFFELIGGLVVEALDRGRLA